MGGGLAGKRRSLSILAWSIRGLTAQRLSAAADAPTETPPRLQTPTPQGPTKQIERMMKRWRMFWPAVAAARPVPKRTAGDAATGCSGEAPDRDECTATRLPVGVSIYMISAREKGFAFISLVRLPDSKPTRTAHTISHIPHTIRSQESQVATTCTRDRYQDPEVPRGRVSVSDIARASGLRRETVSNVVNGKTHKRVREHDLPELETPEQRAAKYARFFSNALELRGRRRR